MKQRFVLLFLLISTTSCAPPFFKKYRTPRYDISNLDKTAQQAYVAVDKFLQDCITHSNPLAINRYSRIDTIIINKSESVLEINFNEPFSYLAFRPENTAQIRNAIEQNLGKKFKNYKINLRTIEQPIEALIPNIFRPLADYDTTRLAREHDFVIPLVTNLSAKYAPELGLQNRHIALWHSHGWYFEQGLQRWEWQRARVFQTVEDLLPMSFTVPYLLPMLENAGAHVLLPRERDIQTNEVIVDNDSPADSLVYLEKSVGDTIAWQDLQPGFSVGNLPYIGSINPFYTGTCRSIKSDTLASAAVEWIPDIPETGDYFVSITYAPADSHATDARYTVFHTGGHTEFSVNQQIGGRTWIYLGQFRFTKGFFPQTQKVVLTNLSTDSSSWVSADAVRFGGGMGTVSRGGSTSGRPRFVEAARYYLQFAGMPDSLVYNVTEQENDYIDDYLSRGEWVNYLRGSPFGPAKNRQEKGLGIPIDLSLSFHTDAGFTRNDTTLGTLLIYSSMGSDTTRFFPDFVSRYANRDFADMLQTQLVEDIRHKYDPVWTRRSIWDKEYSEAYRPNVPSALLELLSHHNFLDMKFALDPRFRFDVSRSIYKAMLKFLAVHNQIEYVVQPLPVDHFAIEFVDSAAIELHWQAVADSLEPTAEAKNFIVYTRIDSGAFDNGRLVSTNKMVIDSLETDKIYSYKVSAVNEGGQSMPSEILSVCRADSSKGVVLIINAFDRVATAATIEEGSLLGFSDLWDQGVPDRYDLNYIGQQYNLDANSNWLDDDAPGHGASFSTHETKIIAGNTFDFPYLHGTSLRNLGYSFVSCSDETIESQKVNLNKFNFVDFIFGEEKETAAQRENMPKHYRIFTPELRQAIAEYTQHGGNLFMSGSYIGTDLISKPDVSFADSAFAQDTLKFRHRTNWAARSGGIVANDPLFHAIIPKFSFNTELNSQIYAAEAPDGLEPAGVHSRTILRYAENNISAAVGHKGNCDIVIFGFPFETILEQKSRDSVMRAVMRWFDQK
ncbi:MAG: xanthan lyase [Calditrichaeota bacterium]|nr:MAG: xanthan lyase [Calditrichota bacterium]